MEAKIAETEAYNYHLEGHCYVLLDGKHEEVTELVMKHRHDIIMYPERAMRLVDLASYRPYVKSVLTESPWIIGMAMGKSLAIEFNKNFAYPSKFI